MYKVLPLLVITFLAACQPLPLTKVDEDPSSREPVADSHREPDALTQPENPNSPIEILRTKTRGLDPSGRSVIEIQQRDDSDSSIVFVVSSNFLAQPEALQFELAKALDQTWYSVYNADAEKASPTSIRLVTQQGTVLAETNVWGEMEFISK